MRCSDSRSPGPLVAEIVIGTRPLLGPASQPIGSPKSGVLSEPALLPSRFAGR